MGIKIAAIGLIIISGIIGANFIIQNSLIKNVNLSDVSLDTGDVSGEKSQENLKIENPIKWIEKQNESKTDYPKNISEAISEIKKAGSEIGKIIKEVKSSLPLSLQIVAEMGTSSAVDGINNNASSSNVDNAINNQPMAFGIQETADINNNTNPRNLENLEYLISEMKKVGAKQNMSDEKLLAAEKAIREVAATSTDLMAEFYKSVNVKYTNAEGGGFFKKILTFSGIIKISNAVSGLAFGGKIVSALPCNCSPGVWYLGIMPTAPTYATLLSYRSGTQIYSNYIPTPHPKQYFLGFYAPTPNVTCWQPVPSGTGCFSLPDWGLIMPIVGSSL